MAKFASYKEMGKKIAEEALDGFEYQGKTIREWVKIITEREPCEDCISREEALKCFDYTNTRPGARNAIKELPSVYPKAKIGHWIEDAKTYYEELNKRGLGVDEYTPYFTDDIACSECLAKYSVLDNETQFFKYCPNCGAKMAESEVRNV